jgi:antitoxin YefM
VPMKAAVSDDRSDVVWEAFVLAMLAAGPVAERRSRYGDNPALFSASREIAHLEAPGVIDVRITRAGWSQVDKLAILIAMSVSEQMPLADVKNHLSEVVDRLQREHGRVIITRHGHPAAVVMSVADLESLEETLDVMDSAALLGDIRESLAELGNAGAPVLTREEALRLISGR